MLQYIYMEKTQLASNIIRWNHQFYANATETYIFYRNFSFEMHSIFESEYKYEIFNLFGDVVFSKKNHSYCPCYRLSARNA